MTQQNNARGPSGPRRQRCALRTEGHGTNGVVLEFVDRPALWVHGSIESLALQFLDEVPGAQPVRFVPDLTQPHTVEDPVGIPLEMYHHASVEIRRRVAQGLIPLWYPNACVLVIGHRRFEMSLVPVPECRSVAEAQPSFIERRDQHRALQSELRLEIYREAFAEWMRYRDLDRVSSPPLRVFEALVHAWDQPQSLITSDHLEFRDALLTALTLLVDVHKRPEGES